MFQVKKKSAIKEARVLARVLIEDSMYFKMLNYPPIAWLIANGQKLWNGHEPLRCGHEPLRCGLERL